MQPLDRGFFHFISDGVLVISRQPFHSGSHQKMRSGLLHYAEQFVAMTLTIADVDTAFRLIAECGGPP
jgi:hypothetical protein